jgi:atypical dual specificity phosphatase
MSGSGAAPEASAPQPIPSANTPPLNVEIVEDIMIKPSSGPRKSIHFDHVVWTPPPILTPRKSSFLTSNQASGSPLANAGAAALAVSSLAAFASPRGRSSSGFAKNAGPLPGAIGVDDGVPLADLLFHQYRPWLVLGDAEAAHSQHLLQTNKITHILNVADDVENMFPSEFQYENLHVKDFGQDAGISRVFEQAAKFAEEVKNTEGKKLLVHCFAGMNRSPTIVIALLMILEKKSLREAYCEVKRKSPSTGLFEDSRKELLKYELEKFGKNSMTMEDFSKDLSHLEHHRRSGSGHQHAHHPHGHSHPHAAEAKAETKAE